jgi:ABC-2 type transport system ATP-binding protein
MIPPAGATTGRTTDWSVEVDGLGKVFTDFWRRPKVRALDNVTFRVPSGGSVFGLLGPNGSGKSTSIKILLGLLRPSSGSARVLGAPPDDIAAKRLIGYLPEESCLYRYLTPRETLTFYGRLFCLTPDERRRRVDELLAMVGLSHAADRPVGEFSKGMARRVGLAQALINNPALLILDEPTSGLDPIACRQVKDLISTLARGGKTILMSSHLLADVEDVCTELAILHNGRVRAAGLTRELLVQSDRTRITFPSLPAETLRRLIAGLRAEAGAEPQVDHPSLNLEQFFLEVVEAASRTDTSPTGAGLGGKPAPFLVP